MQQAQLSVLSPSLWLHPEETNAAHPPHPHLLLHSHRELTESRRSSCSLSSASSRELTRAALSLSFVLTQRQHLTEKNRRPFLCSNSRTSRPSLPTATITCLTSSTSSSTSSSCCYFQRASNRCHLHRHHLLAAPNNHPSNPVSISQNATEALSILGENKGGYDLVISDVHMPGVDGFQLLKLVGSEMDIPVILMSYDIRKDIVMEGIKNGACDYLVKPVREEELQNIWQHIIRKRFYDGKENDIASSLKHSEQNKYLPEDVEDASQSYGGSDACSKYQKKKRNYKRNNASDKDRGNSSSLKKPRVVWSAKLHEKFVAAVNHLGIDKVVPKKVLGQMNVPGLSRENVASHLQKFRQHLKKLIGEVNQSLTYNSDTGLYFQGLSISDEIAQQALAAMLNDLIEEDPWNKEMPISNKSVILQVPLQGSRCLPEVAGPRSCNLVDPYSGRMVRLMLQQQPLQMVLPKPHVSTHVPMPSTDFDAYGTSNNFQALFKTSQRHPNPTHSMKKVNLSNTAHVKQLPISSPFQPSISIQMECNQLCQDQKNTSSLNEDAVPLQLSFIHDNMQFSASHDPEVRTPHLLTPRQFMKSPTNITSTAPSHASVGFQSGKCHLLTSQKPVIVPFKSSNSTQQGKNVSNLSERSQLVTRNKCLMSPLCTAVGHNAVQGLDKYDNHVNSFKCPASVTSSQPSTHCISGLLIEASDEKLNEYYDIHGNGTGGEMSPSLGQQVTNLSTSLVNQFDGASPHNRMTFWNSGPIDDKEMDHDDFYLNMLCSPKAEDSVLLDTSHN